MKDQYFHKLKAVMHFDKNNKKRESDGVIEKNTFREKTFIRVIERKKKFRQQFLVSSASTNRSAICQG